MTGREVARLVRRGSADGVRKALQRLATQGVVDIDEAGRALLYGLNRDHIAAPVVDALVALRGELYRRLREELTNSAIPAADVSLFGSAARGEGDTASDRPLRRTTRRRPRRRSCMAGAAGPPREERPTLDRQPAGIVEIGESDRSWLLDEEPAILSSLRSDAVTLDGPEVTAIIGAGR